METKWFQGVLELAVQPVASRKATNQKDRLYNNLIVECPALEKEIRLTDIGFAADFRCRRTA
jgi:hypothetical protein